MRPNDYFILPGANLKPTTHNLQPTTYNLQPTTYNFLLFHPRIYPRLEFHLFDHRPQSVGTSLCKV
ncbi:MAG: hypothetical protein RL282_1497 [Bacteroidota bacterium]